MNKEQKLRNNPLPVEETVEETINDTVAKVADDKTEETPEKTTPGIVDNCVKLNLRSTPEVGDNVITQLLAGSTVLVVKDESTEDFYKVIAESGAEGYCMKDYVTIKY